jgi:Patatin-like phospholipase
MTDTVGDKAIGGSSASVSKDRVYTLAAVLDDEFEKLHGTPGQKRTAASEEKQPPQPLEDPSLSPADQQSREQRIEPPEIGKTPSEQEDDDPEAKKLRELWEKVHALKGDGRTALCLSGGGVRSAAFNLGVLQGLARLELLGQFHYLSTVSGGGYIGSWLFAWRYRCKDGISDVTSGLAWPDRIGNAKAPSSRVPPAISNLRRGTNYLTPVKGILSPDAWATITLVGRNLILNHVVIVPLIAALLLMAKFLGAAARYDHLSPNWEQLANGLFGALAFQDWFKPEYMASLLLAGFFAGLGWIVLSIARPSWDVRRPSPRISTVSPASTLQGESRAQILAPRWGIGLVLFAAFIFAFETANDFPKEGPISWDWMRFAVFPVGGAAGSIVAFVLAVGVAAVKRALGKSPKTAEWAARFLGHVPEVPPGPVTVSTAGARAVFLLTVAAALAGGAGGVVLGAGEELAVYLPRENAMSTALLLSITPLWFVISYNVGDAVFLGLTARRPSPKAEEDWSDRWGDEEREWVARTGGYLMVFALGFSILCLLTLFGPWLIGLAVRYPLWTVALAAVAALSAFASIGLAASPFSTQFGTAPRETRLPVRTTLLIATPIFSGLLIALLSTALDLTLFKEPLLTLLSKAEDPLDPSLKYVAQGPFDPRELSDQGWLLVLACGLAIFSGVAAYFVNINRFSLYDLYRMRLTREFLGASNSHRRADFWTGFDESDDIPLAALWPPKDGVRRLYPVINAALNMAATKRLEWQDRKAVSFVLTPLYCGSGATHALGFRKTKDYAGGIRLGWALTVSGAAVSPNAGYATMPGLALLMTLFNLRLGVWSGNTGKAGDKTYQLRGPTNALRPLVTEALARTDDQSKYVYLSDGGHFDNLGVYEMLRRRCRFIVISDVTCDPKYVYAELGSVVRKAAIDFGIRIRFKHLDMAQRGETAVKGAYSAYAVIEYPEADANGQRRHGYLLYIKSYFRGLEEPADVRAYALENLAFPHDTTLNQFFGEAQFESYRALGGYTVMELARKAGFDLQSKDAKSTRLAQFFRGAERALAGSRPEEEDLIDILRRYANARPEQTRSNRRNQPVREAGEEAHQPERRDNGPAHALRL